MSGEKDVTLPDVPLEDLFHEIEYIDTAHRTPLRWLSVKSAAEHLNVSIRTIRRYIKSGMVETKIKAVQGHKRVFISNISVYRIADVKKVDRYNDSIDDNNSEDD